MKTADFQLLSVVFNEFKKFSEKIPDFFQKTLDKSDSLWYN